MNQPESNSTGDQPDSPSLHIDSDWKAQAQAEKERLSRQEQERGKSPRGRGQDELPPADFRGLVGILASQALMSLGGYADPQSGRVVVDLAGAQFAIDLLHVLETKTAGNLDAEESKELKLVLDELRNRFVHFAALVAKQTGQAAEIPGVSQASPASPTQPKIEIP